MITERIKIFVNYCISNFIYLTYQIFNRPILSSETFQESTNETDSFIKSTLKKDVTNEIVDAVNQLRAEFDVPSIQVSLVLKENAEFHFISGYANLESKKRATLNTVYYLGSITKIYVQAIILKLVQDKLISLNDSASKDINISSDNKGVTIKHLLNHTSGLYDPLLNKFHLFKLYFLGKKSTPDELVNKVRKNKPYFAPGENRKYSNTGYVLLGLLAEKVTNKSFSNILKEFFLDNYNLTNTFYSAQDKLPHDLATGYDLDKYHLGKKANIDQFPLFLPTLSFTSGGIVSNASDVSRFLYNIFNTDVLDDQSKRKLRLFFSVKNESGVVLRTNIGHMCGYNHFSGYSHSKKVSIVVLTNLTYTSSGICIPEKIAEKIIDIMLKKGII
ncbi:serine hydrolase domain-containing protein [Brevibacillus brevis]|uniref:serine hydrolase domain-containing protein n=1 Tax=Brevibacillus brevis TaxID=1393 RepID=UPI0025A54FA6|nr:serine hydrolase domain-containing protein [Brevibacillus brevis]WJQ83543.1 serine hydrolase domain-containing protein [Brevibacillus brevis]